MKRILSMLLVICMVALSCLAFTSCNNSKVKVGITIYEPMNYYDAEGNLIGFDTEFATELFKRLGKDVEFVEIDWDNKFVELENKSIDCIWNGMTITEEAKLNSDVSTPYAKNAQVVVTKKAASNSYEALDDLKGLKVAVEKGSAAEGQLTDAKWEKGSYIQVDKQSTALTEVMSGNADACIIDLTMANSMLKEGTDFDKLAIALTLAEEEYGISCRKGDKMLDDINRVMAEMKEDGTLAAMAEKYNVVLY